MPLQSKGCGVRKTLELGTTGYKSDVSGKAQKIVFQNDVRKPVFRCNRGRELKERICSPAVQSLGSERSQRPMSFYVPLRKTTRLSAPTRRQYFGIIASSPKLSPFHAAANGRRIEAPDLVPLAVAGQAWWRVPQGAPTAAHAPRRGHPGSWVADRHPGSWDRGPSSSPGHAAASPPLRSHLGRRPCGMEFQDLAEQPPDAWRHPAPRGSWFNDTSPG